ncbi:MaoC/PaaZ C-terminal domain-containing protein [Amycolatopsis speibonae]|uniref:MaoC/PaaZ C-terminal domain-containing protein n=1 Tax=Amycolatopsis speibonae TaxID=1450224 RepID=A0ABV7P7H1_9PSEU
MNAGEWMGRPLGERTVAYDERDAILYALAVGAKAAQLDLVFEERLRVLPTFALTLAQWAPDALGSAGAFDTGTAVHGAQRLEVLRPLPRSGELVMKAWVRDVWDKGSAAVVEVEVESHCFVATWSIFAPGAGGFGGDRGPSAPPRPATPARLTTQVPTGENQSALYRLLGDRHHMHVDPEAARAAGQPRPFLHGLCTLAAVLFPLAAEAGAHPADLQGLACRFAGPVFPGDTVEVAFHPGETATGFEASVGDRPVLTGGEVRFR